MRLQLIGNDGKIITAWKIGKSRDADGDYRQYDFYTDDLEMDIMDFEDVWTAMREAALKAIV